MAVYKRTYKAYAGPITHPAWRFLVIQRYAFRSIFRSRFLLVGYIACFFLPLLAVCALYLNQNASLMAMIGKKAGGFLKVDGSFFMNFLASQGVLAGLLTAFIGPTLIAPDLTNGALPMYLSRPFTRVEYILGKGMVLGSLIASITLIPALLLFTIQSSLVGFDWFVTNFYLATAIAVSNLLLMAVLILLGLAMSAWVRWKLVAGALILAAFAAGKGFGAVINAAMRTSAGLYLDLEHLLSTAAGALFRNAAPDEPISAAGAVVALFAICSLLLLLINRKLRVCEVAG